MQIQKQMQTNMQISVQIKRQISMQISVQIHMQPRTNTTGTSALQHLHCTENKLKPQNYRPVIE